jgi:serine/threonine protein kinase
MGVVYKARDPIINRLVALKTITANVADNPALLQRFYREAQSAGSLNHPNIVGIYEMGEEDNVPFIAMQLVDGENLGTLIARRASIPLSLKLVYAVEACRAFAYAHKQGIVHRDIKPGNVMVSRDGTVKVVDFGIARVLENSKTQTGMLIGTFAYMSPEVFNGEHADERSDIFSFGVLLYELLAYTRPFPGEIPAALMQSICLKDPIPLRSVMPECPPELEEVVHRTLLKPVNERTQTMDDLLLELDPICKGLQAQAVADLVAEARKLFSGREFAAARELLVQARQVDYTNRPARVLMEEVNVELKRLEKRPQVEKLVSAGRTLLEQGRLQEAQLEAESALKLDSSFDPAGELLRQVKSEIARAKLIREWLQSARDRLAEGMPEEAEAFLGRIQETDPANRDAANLLQQVLEEKAKRQRRIYLLDTLQQARTLWMQQNYVDCIALLTSLQAEFGEEEEVQKLLGTAREDLAEQQKRRTLERARTLLAAGSFQECEALLIGLRDEFPGDDEIVNLVEQARKEEVEQRKQEGLKEARNLLAARRYEDCLQLLALLKTHFPQQNEIARLVEAVHEDRKAEQKEQGLTEARTLLASQRYDECQSLLNGLQAQFPGDPEFPKLLDALCEERAEQRRLEGLSEAQKLLASKQYGESLAQLNELKKQFPDDKQIPALVETIQKEQAEQRRLEGLSEAQKLLSSRQFAESLALLNKLAEQFPDDPQIPAMAQSVQRECAEQHRLEGLAEAQKLLASKQFAESLALLTSLKTEFPDDIQIPALAEAVLKEQAEQCRLEGLSEAQKFFASKQYVESLALLSELKSLFPDDPQIPALAAAVQKEATEQGRLEGLSEARKLLVSRQYGESLALLGELNEKFPGDKQIAALVGQVQEGQAEQKKLDGISRAQMLLASKQYDESLTLLGELKNEFPGDKQIPALAEAVQRSRAEYQKSEGLSQAQKFLASKQFAQSLTLLNELQNRFPGDKQFSELADAVRRDQAEYQKFQGLAEARKLRAARQYAESLALLNQLKTQFPDEKEILRLAETVLKDQAEQSRLQGLGQARTLLASKQLAESLALLNTLKAQFPGDKEILRLAEAVQKDQAEQQKQEGLAKARKLRAAKQYPESITLLSALKAQFPDDREIPRLIEGIRKDQAEQQKLQGLSEARNQLASGRVDESFAILVELRKDFPHEDDISRLINTVEQEKAEQQKQKRLAEARSLLGAQRFADALAVLEPLLKANAKDPLVLKLRALILEEQEKLAKATRLARELKELKKLVADEKYETAISRAQALLPDFAHEADLVRLLEFSRNRKEQIERERRLNEVLAEAQKYIAANQYAEAILTARKGLETFEGNPDLQRLLEQAENQQKKEYIRQQIQQRVREIKIKIHREEFSDAVRLAQDAVTTLGPDTDLTQLLTSAQVETQARDKKRDQGRKLENVRALLEMGDLEGATLLLDETIKKEDLDESDPRVDRLSKEIAAATRVKDSTQTPSVVESGAKEYALMEGPPPIVGPQEGDISETIVAPVNSASQATPSLPQPEVMPQPQAAPEPVTAEPEVVAVAKLAKTRRVAPRVKTSPPLVPLWRRPTVLAAELLGLVLAVSLGTYSLYRSKAEQGTASDASQKAAVAPAKNTPEMQQRKLIDSADKDIGQGDFKGAESTLAEAKGINGPLTAEIDQKLADVDRANSNAAAAAVLQQEESLWGQATADVASGNFAGAQQSLRAILKLPPDGRRKVEAKQYLSEVIPRRQREEQLFAQAQQAMNGKDARGLQQAADLFGQVAKLNGPRQPAALKAQQDLTAKVAASNALVAMLDSARADVKRGDFRSARQILPQLQQAGGDPASLSQEINEAEQARFSQLEASLNQQKQRTDESAIQSLKDLQPQLQALADGGGPTANDARRDAAGIPDAILGVQARLTYQHEEAAYQQADQRYRASGNDPGVLEASRSNFQAIVKGGGHRAADAQKIAEEIDARVLALSAAAATPAAPPVVRDETPAVLAAVQRYAAAFDRRDADALRQVWPSMTAQIYGKLKASFAVASDIQLQLANEKVDLAADGASAVVNADITRNYTPKGEKTLVTRDHTIFHLIKSNGNWLIRDLQ